METLEQAKGTKRPADNFGGRDSRGMRHFCQARETAKAKWFRLQKQKVSHQEESSFSLETGMLGPANKHIGDLVCHLA